MTKKEKREELRVLLVTIRTLVRHASKMAQDHKMSEEEIMAIDNCARILLETSWLFE